MSEKKETPMMKQYNLLKKENPDGLLFYRMGDFYELFYDDAVLASKILKITLTKRNPKSDIPMAGIPFHAAESYISKLVSDGYSIVVCEQDESSNNSGKLLKRSVNRIITPSTVSDDTIISPVDISILAASYKSNGIFCLSELNLSNGDFVFSIFNEENDFENKIINSQYSELLIPFSFSNYNFIKNKKGIKYLDEDYFTHSENFTILRKHNLISEKSINEKFTNALLSASGSIVNYLTKSLNVNIPPYVKSLINTKDLKTLNLDNITIKNLELLNSNGFNQNKNLFSVLNLTTTSMGARKLKNWILNPSNEKDVIEKRLLSVEEINNKKLSDQIDEILNCISDIERISLRISQKQTKPRDLSSLNISLSKMPEIKTIIDNNSSLSKTIKKIPNLSSLCDYISSSIVNTPPVHLKDGGIIKNGFNKELDQLRHISENTSDFIFDIEEKERSILGVKNLKINYNKISGFYISISKTKPREVPEHYILKNSLKNENRYTTKELKELEEKMITSNSKIITLEKIIYNQIIDNVSLYLKELNLTADILSDIDVLNSFSKVSIKNNYVKPSVFEKETIIKDGRHPVVENDSSFYFCPNDFELKGKRVILLTAPNMGGKSTYMRQNALIYIMAHIGCFVPATSAKIKETDRIFTRIGSGDNLSEGESTFMVEMKETANIMNNMTKKSFVLIDEIGRGTSTSDGLALAWAFLDKLSKTCDTIFSTHYFELVEYEKESDFVVNMHLKTTKFKNNIIFLHKVDYGYIDNSYGIEVAEMAGIKDDILEVAKNKKC